MFISYTEYLADLISSHQLKYHEIADDTQLVSRTGSYYPLASAILPLHTFSVASLKLAASSRPTAPPSGSAK